MIHKTETREIRGEWIEFIYHLQETICKALEKADGKALFLEDEWQRADGKGGGGLTRVIQNGNVFEKGGVNTSVVYGHVTDKMRKQLGIDGAKWFAAGLSLVIHPVNPFVPTVHCNYRMFELYNEEDILTDRWFGGGTDLTPYYLFEEDAKHFHQTYKSVCDEFDPSLYPTFKKECDDYFVNKHRNNERRGIGGIFYDHQREDENHSRDFWMNFGKSCGNAFITTYLPIVEKRKNVPYSEKNKHWQEIRRGRYVEFNLIHDRGTLFGLKTNGRTESILMSLRPTVRFEYNYQPEPGSEEDKLLQACLNPREWV
jgi:coproporphyrinogen III oxidase